ncbi:hypothetical protein CIHG_09046 [Coccidioides immitis H538.4]|uniref:Uncharacterized protein n=1 Tax=Coccidioides immitis H538.4 TaxID=396776 RepID=A0A0J8S4F4_COCIT|nr:hypothetical protein CIHG_09046 [Coccidioides immitis H538.4]
MSPTSFLSFLFMMETEAMINSPQWQHPPTPTTQKTGMDDVLRPRRRDVPLAAAQPKPDRGKPGSVQTFPAPTRPTRRRVARARGLPIAWQPSDDDRHHRPPNLISRPPTASSLPACSSSSTTLPVPTASIRTLNDNLSNPRELPYHRPTCKRPLIISAPPWFEHTYSVQASASPMSTECCHYYTVFPSIFNHRYLGLPALAFPPAMSSLLLWTERYTARWPTVPRREDCAAVGIELHEVIAILSGIFYFSPLLQRIFVYDQLNTGTMPRHFYRLFR